MSSLQSETKKATSVNNCGATAMFSSNVVHRARLKMLPHLLSALTNTVRKRRNTQEKKRDRGRMLDVEVKKWRAVRDSTCARETER